MSLQTNLQQNEENPRGEGDLFGRDILWHYFNNEKDLTKILDDPRGVKAIKQFRGFHTSEQKALYPNLLFEKMSNLIKYLKEQKYIR